MGTWYRLKGWHFHKKQELCNKRHEQMTQASITNFRSKLTWLSSHSVEFKLMQNNHRGNCIVKFQNLKIPLPFNYKCEEKLPGFTETGWKFVRHVITGWKLVAQCAKITLTLGAVFICQTQHHHLVYVPVIGWKHNHGLPFLSRENGNKKASIR
jgi:hypothetical protein